MIIKVMFSSTGSSNWSPIALINTQEVALRFQKDGDPIPLEMRSQFSVLYIHYGTCLFVQKYFSNLNATP